MPCRLGPTALRPPASTVWQILHRAKIAWPAATSAALAPGGARTAMQASIAAGRIIGAPPKRSQVRSGEIALLPPRPQAYKDEAGCRASGREGGAGSRVFRLAPALRPSRDRPAC